MKIFEKKPWFNKKTQRLDSKCNWPGCDRDAGVCTLTIKGKRMCNSTTHCLRHSLIKYSGRVDHQNWFRDRHREYLTGVCAIDGVTFKEEYQKTKKRCFKLGLKLSKHEMIRRTMQTFEGDHKDGNPDNNSKENIQTLTKAAHKFKTDVSGDSNPKKPGRTHLKLVVNE